MSNLEQKRNRARRLGFHVGLVRKNKQSEAKGMIVYQGGVVYRPYTHIYSYNWVGTGNYMVYGPNAMINPLAGLTYRQAVQVAYMLSHKRKGM